MTARLRRPLVVVQVTLAVALTVCTTLWVKALAHVLDADIGFQPANALTFRYSVGPLNLRSPAAVDAFNRQLTEAIRSIPGVIAAGTISHLPYDKLPNWSMAYHATPGDPGLAREADVRPVSPGFLDAVGGRAVAGRFFTEADDLNAQRVVVVDRRLAERTWPGEDAVGKRLMVEISATSSAEMTVIGVIEHLRYRAIDSEVREQLFLPVRQLVSGPYAMVVRTNTDAASVVMNVRAAASSLDRRLPLWDIRPLADYYAEAAAERRFAATLLLTFAAAGLFLAAIGLFGLLASLVENRRHEFGVRLAVGASPRNVAFTVVRDGLAVVAAGAAGGVVLGLLGGYALAAHLYGVTPHDPAALATAAVFTLTVALLACGLPAYRAARTDPNTLLRS